MNWIAYVGSGILLILVAILVKESWRNKVANVFREHRYGITSLGISIVSFNAFVWLLAGCADLQLLMRTMLYFAVPMFILSLFKKSNSWWVDLAVVLLLWLPVEFGLIKVAAPISKNAYTLVKFSAIIFGLISYVAFRYRNFSLDWRFSKSDLKLVFAMFWVLFVVLLPIALAMEFVKFGISDKPVYLWPVALILIWFAPALAEEFIFRGVIQNFFMQKLHPAIAIAVASVIFGFSHINNKAGGYNYPNWRYVILATIAGAGYGYVYYKRKKCGSLNALGTSATLHCLVDFVWFVFMKAGK